MSDLSNFIKNIDNKERGMPQSFLIYGDNSDYLLSEGISFSKDLLCLEKHENSCKCQSCKSIKINKKVVSGHPDFLGLDFEWSGESKSGEGVKGIRNIIHQLSMSPLWGKRKVAILRYIDYFNKESANALLKTLEEPNKSSYLILVAKNINNVLPTISSRTINLELKATLDDEIIHELSSEEKEWLDIFNKPLHEKFNIVEKVAKKNEVVHFLDLIQKHVIEKNRKELNNSDFEDKKKVKDRSQFLNKLIKTKEILTRTNANKRLGLECLMLEVEKAGI